MCESENCFLQQLSSKEYSFSLKQRVFIEGPQGSGKTSLASSLGTELNVLYARGFPSGEFLKKSPEPRHVCEEAFRLALEPFETTHKIYDRSPISQFAWMARTGSNIDDCILCTIKALSILSKNSPIGVIFIATDANSCIIRQTDGLYAINALEIEKEVQIYNDFHSRLSQISIANLRILSLPNYLTTAYSTFVNNGLDAIQKIGN